MTREEALQVLIIKANKGAFVEDIINQIFDEHEVQLKQAYVDGSNSTNELIQSLYKQIEQLKDKQ